MTQWFTMVYTTCVHQEYAQETLGPRQLIPADHWAEEGTEASHRRFAEVL